MVNTGSESKISVRDSVADRLMHGPDHPSKGGFIAQGRIIAQGICRKSSDVSIFRVASAIESYLALSIPFMKLSTSGY